MLNHERSVAALNFTRINQCRINILSVVHTPGTISIYPDEMTHGIAILRTLF